MSDPSDPYRANETDAESVTDPESDTDRQPPRLSAEEVERIKDYEELEEFMEERPEGPLSIISDEDVPGAPG